MRKSTNIGPKIDQQLFKNRPKSVPRSSWRALEAILAPRAKKVRSTPLRPPRLGSQVGAQNRSKLVPRAIQNVIIFWMDLESHFWSDLVPTWVHLDSPNPPKVRPSWSQNRSKLGCWFETCFLKAVVWIFINFCCQHNMAEGTISSALPSNY